MALKTTDEKIFSMALSKFIPMLFAVIVGTNTVSLTLQRLSNLEEKSTYNVNANKRRLDNAITELEYKRKIEALQKDIKKYKHLE
jgi:hypothetical protein